MRTRPQTTPAGEHSDGGRRRPVSSWLFRQVCKRDAVVPVYDDERFRQRFFGYDVESTARFLARFEGRLDFDGRSVLDVGCGRGATCFEAARRGASRVVGVDLELAPQAQEMVAQDPELASRVELVRTDGSLDELGSETFDLVLSKDGFEHYAEPEFFVFTISRFLKPVLCSRSAAGRCGGARPAATSSS